MKTYIYNDSFFDKFDDTYEELLMSDTEAAKAFLVEEGFNSDVELVAGKKMIKKLEFKLTAINNKQKDDILFEKAFEQLKVFIERNKNMVEEELRNLLNTAAPAYQFRNLEKLDEEGIRELLTEIDLVKLLEELDKREKLIDMPISKGALACKKLIESHGIDDTTEFPIEYLVSGFGASLRELPLANADGRIVFGNRKTIITVNSKIEFEGKRRFTIAHELGHYAMHRNLIPIHDDTDATLEYFQNGHQETEANEFASELLMPEDIFIKECTGKKFSPDLLRQLSIRFKTSLTSTAYRYFQLGNHPICLFYSYDNKVKYWKRPDNYPHFIIDRTKLNPPEDSVAYEYFDKKTIYQKHESKQPIWKSTWFVLNNWDNDMKYKFFEFCIITPKYNTVLSVVWEEI